MLNSASVRWGWYVFAPEPGQLERRRAIGQGFSRRVRNCPRAAGGESAPRIADSARQFVAPSRIESERQVFRAQSWAGLYRENAHTPGRASGASGVPRRDMLDREGLRPIRHILTRSRRTAVLVSYRTVTSMMIVKRISLLADGHPEIRAALCGAFSSPAPARPQRRLEGLARDRAEDVTPTRLAHANHSAASTS